MRQRIPEFRKFIECHDAYFIGCSGVVPSASLSGLTRCIFNIDFDRENISYLLVSSQFPAEMALLQRLSDAEMAGSQLNRQFAVPANADGGQLYSGAILYVVSLASGKDVSAHFDRISQRLQFSPQLCPDESGSGVLQEFERKMAESFKELYPFAKKLIGAMGGSGPTL
ncbi:hypothetical protein HYU13_04695 [Candidatus Woesearchaeota archaeon]|nr:hypothetical protein [Candidatus Woesearchaeota archaeon]